MRKALVFLFLLLPRLCLPQSAIQWSPSDFTLYAPAAQQITITPLWGYTVFGSNIVSHAARSFSTGTIITSTGKTLSGIPGSLIVSNVIYGGYQVQFFQFNNPIPVASFTNNFTNGMPAFANAKDFPAVSFGSTFGDEFAYTINQMDAILANFSPGGGSATNAFRTQVSGVGLNISTNLTDFIYTLSLNANLQGFAQWSTNAFAALFDSSGSALNSTNALGIPSGLAAFRATNSFDVAGAASAATNNYPWGPLYDPAGAATAATNGAGISSGLAAFRTTNTFDTAGSAIAATNGIGISSGLASFRGTNTFAPTNVATVTVAGLVKVDNSSITVAADGTISATTGGSGTVTSITQTVPQGFSVAGSPITGSGTLAITRSGGNDNLLGGGITNAALIIATNKLGVGIASGASPNATNVFQVDTLGGADAFGLNTNGDAFFSRGLNVGGIPVATTNQFLGTSGLAGNSWPYLDNGTNLTSTNLFFTTEILAASSATNYTLNFQGADKKVVHSANTNANFTFSNIGTNRQFDLFVYAVTSSVNCNVTFPAHVIHNNGWTLTCSNGTMQTYHFESHTGFDSTNVTVTGGDYYHRD